MNNFSHIYIEEGAQAYALAEHVLRRFPNAKRVWIKDYKEVFSRSNQHFQLQKKSMKLVLGIKKENFLYEGSDNSQSFGYRNFYYNTLMLNCVYNCDYCYLQGMYPSANIVAFVNIEDFFEATRKAVEERLYKSEPLYLSISYNTDLLALESVVPYSAYWIEFVRTYGDILIEIRTKSANYKAIRHLEVTPRVILAWTLSPADVAWVYEKGTPSLSRRIEAVKEAISDGWQVRLCFDPILRVENWKEKYTRFIEKTFDEIPAGKIHDVSVGVFRMNATYFHRIKKGREDSSVLYYPFEVENETVSYPAPQRKEIVSVIYEKLCQYLPEEKIALWV
jgi:spore photoproduct lyase